MVTRESGPPSSAAAGSLNMPTFATVRMRSPRIEPSFLAAISTFSTRSRNPGGQADQYEGVGARVADLMRTFDQDVEKLRTDAEAEAARIVAEAKSEADRIHQGAERSRGEVAAKAERIQAKARTEADKIRLDAQSKAEDLRLQATEALREAKEESGRVLSGLGSRRKALMEELRVIRDRMVDTTKGIEATIEAGVKDQVRSWSPAYCWTTNASGTTAFARWRR